MRKGACARGSVRAHARAHQHVPALQDGYCDQRRLKEIVAHLETLEAAAVAPASKQRITAKLTRRPAADSENPDGADAAGRPEETPLSNLADASMILRDPPVFHMLLHETVRAAEFGVCIAVSDARDGSSDPHARRRGGARSGAQRRPKPWCPDKGMHVLPLPP